MSEPVSGHLNREGKGAVIRRQTYFVGLVMSFESEIALWDSSSEKATCRRLQPPAQRLWGLLIGNLQKPPGRGSGPLLCVFLLQQRSGQMDSRSLPASGNSVFFFPVPSLEKCKIWAGSENGYKWKQKHTFSKPFLFLIQQASSEQKCTKPSQAAVA